MTGTVPGNRARVIAGFGGEIEQNLTTKKTHRTTALTSILCDVVLQLFSNVVDRTTCPFVGKKTLWQIFLQNGERV